MEVASFGAAHDARAGSRQQCPFDPRRALDHSCESMLL